MAPLARAAVAAGADGPMIEVHHEPEKALSDGAQSLYPPQFATLMQEIKSLRPGVWDSKKFPCTLAGRDESYRAVLEPGLRRDLGGF